MVVFSLLCHGTAATGILKANVLAVSCLDYGYCLSEIYVFSLFILQRRRRIDRTMIGEPMNFKVSLLF